jgi:hypothetical protein
MYVYKRPSLGDNKVKVFVHKVYGWTAIVHNPSTKKNLWVAHNTDLRKLKRRMRRAGWIK